MFHQVVVTKLLTKSSCHVVHSSSDPPDNCYLNVKNLPKNSHFVQKHCKNLTFLLQNNVFFNDNFWIFFYIQMAIFRRVRFSGSKYLRPHLSTPRNRQYNPNIEPELFLSWLVIQLVWM